MRKRRFLLASAAAIAALVMPPGSAARSEFSVRDESTISRTLHFGGSGDRLLDVRAIHGSIRVIGADRQDVQLDVLRTVRAETDDDLDAADRDVMLDIVEGTPRIEAIVRERDGDSCGEDSRQWRGQRDFWRAGPRYVVTYDFAIQVPRETRLRLCTVNGREILIEGTRGHFDLENVNGRITMPNVGGSGSARTVNGAIVALFSEQPRDASQFKTTNGEVMVGFPADLSAELTLNAFNGGLFTDFDVQSLPQPVPVAERRGGRFVYRSNQGTRVRAGRGGPELTFETFNGSVRVIRAVR
jgi:hypothetical protein